MQMDQCNGIGGKLDDILCFMHENNILLAAVQETKWGPKSATPKRPGYSFVRLDRADNRGGGLVFIVSDKVPFHMSNDYAINDDHTELQSLVIHSTNGPVTVHNIYIPPAASCSNGFVPSLDFLGDNDYLLLGDINAHSGLWDSTADEDARGVAVAEHLDNADAVFLNDGRPTRVASRQGQVISTAPDITLCSGSLAPSATWSVVPALGSDHLPIIITLATDVPTVLAPRRQFINFNKANWEAFAKDVDNNLSALPLPDNASNGEIRLRTAILKASGRHLPAGRIPKIRPYHPSEAIALAKERDNIRRRDPTSPRIGQLTKRIAAAVTTFRRTIWLDYLNQCKAGSKKLWAAIKSINGAEPPKNNSPLIFNGVPCLDNSKCANRLNALFHQRPTGKPVITGRAAKRLICAQAKTAAHTPWSAEDVAGAIDASQPSKALGPDNISALHLKHLGPIAHRYMAALFNTSMETGHIPHMWMKARVIPLPKPGKDYSAPDSYRPISLLSPVAKLLERLLLPALQQHLPVPDHQHGFRKMRSTTTALMDIHRFITDGLNRRQPVERTVAVALDLSKAFDTVDTRQLMTDIATTDLPPLVKRWTVNYLRGRQAKVEFRGATSKARVIRQGVPQGSVISPALFNFYTASLPEPPAGVHVTTYADDITVMARSTDYKVAGAAISDYLNNSVVPWLEARKLRLSAPKTTVTVFTTATIEHRADPKVTIGNNTIETTKHPKILGVVWDPSVTFKEHASAIQQKIRKSNNVLKALAGSTWGKEKEVLLTTYKAISRSIVNYAAPVWSPQLADTHWTSLQRCQNSAIRSATGCTLMSPIDHLHNESLMLPVKDHNYMLCKQFLVKCRQPSHPNHIGSNNVPARLMKQTLSSKFWKEVNQALQASDNDHGKCSTSIHTATVHSAKQRQRSTVLGRPPPPISPSEKELPRVVRTKLAQLRSGYSPLLNSYMKRLDKSIRDACPLCNRSPHNVDHLFKCRANPTTLTTTDLWTNPKAVAKFLNLEPDPNQT